MSFPDPNERIPSEDKNCGVCGILVPDDDYRPVLKFAIVLHAGRVRLGRFHDACRPADFDTWADAQRDDTKA